jgi:hypothetical protein
MAVGGSNITSASNLGLPQPKTNSQNLAAELESDHEVEEYRTFTLNPLVSKFTHLPGNSFEFHSSTSQFPAILRKRQQGTQEASCRELWTHGKEASEGKLEQSEAVFAS